MKHLVQYVGLTFGADPELFLTKQGRVIGSEKVVPEKGLMSSYHGVVPVVIRDGVQVEFNVPINYCRQLFSNNLGLCFRTLNDHIKSIKPDKFRKTNGIKVVFDQTVEVDPDEMKTLHPKSQQFGCAPSENAYGKQEISITDASQYFYRSAGGHLHLGIPKEYIGDPNRLVMIMDILLGNTCVLIDRNAGNIERRKVYGKAGEYRLPKHGIEYRVLSNFWLRSYQLMSFVTAMARFAVSVAQPNCKVADKLFKLVDMEKVRQAINENDYDLAMNNFNAIKGLIKDTVSFVPPPGTDYDEKSNEVYPLEGSRMDAFDHFVEKGLDHWFTEDIMTHWVRHDYHERHGWEEFLNIVVEAEMKPKVQMRDLVAA